MFCVLMSSQGVSFGPKEEEKKKQMQRIEMRAK